MNSRNIRPYLKALTPKSGALAFAWIALSICLVGGGCSLYMGTQLEQPYVVNVALSQGILVFPVSAVLLVVGAWREKRPAPRTVLWIGVWLEMVLAAILLAAGLALDPAAESSLAVFGVVILCAPLLLVISGVVVFFASRAIPELRQVGKQAQLQRAAEMVNARGEISFSDLAREVEIPLSEVDNILDELLESGAIHGKMELDRQRFMTEAVIEKKRDSLPGMIQAKGQATLAEIGTDLNVSPAELRQWIYQLVQQQRFSGYINWQEGILYSHDADKLRAMNACPKCGGSLSLVGMGVIHCQYCGAEIFL